MLAYVDSPVCGYSQLGGVKAYLFGLCFLFHNHPEYESKLGIDHSRIVDLLQVFDISLTIDVWASCVQRLSLKRSELIDPDML